jgi:hypothetical protein
VIAVAIAAGFLVWYFAIRDTGGGENAGSTATAPGSEPVQASVADLVALSRSLGHPIYWAGPQSNARLELTVKQGDVYLRYLTGNAAIGDQTPKFLSIGTYPYPNAYTTIQALAKHSAERSKPVPGGGLAVTSAQTPTSVYVAYPNQDLEVEVYDPSPARALDIATSGAIAAIG